MAECAGHERCRANKTDSFLMNFLLIKWQYGSMTEWHSLLRSAVRWLRASVSIWRKIDGKNLRITCYQYNNLDAISARLHCCRLLHAHSARNFPSFSEFTQYWRMTQNNACMVCTISRVPQTYFDVSNNFVGIFAHANNSCMSVVWYSLGFHFVCCDLILRPAFAPPLFAGNNFQHPEEARFQCVGQSMPIAEALLRYKSN